MSIPSTMIDLNAVIILFAIVIACVAVGGVILGMIIMSCLSANAYDKGREDEYERQLWLAEEEAKEAVKVAGKEFEDGD